MDKISQFLQTYLAGVTKLKRTRGLAMIESILFIVITLIVILGGLVFFRQAQLVTSVAVMERTVISLQSEVRSIFSKYDIGTGGTDLNMILIAAGAVPENLKSTPPNGLQNTFGGAINVTGNGDSFTVSMTGVPSEACSRLAYFTKQGTGPAGTNIESIEIEGTTFTGSLTSADAANACSTASVVSVVWTFAK